MHTQDYEVLLTYQTWTRRNLTRTRVKKSILSLSRGEEARLEAWAVSLFCFVVAFQYTACFVVKILEVLRPFVSILPEVSKPERKVVLFFWHHSLPNDDSFSSGRSSSRRRCYGLL